MNNKKINSIQTVDTFFPVIDGVVHTVHNYAKILNEKAYSCVVCPATKGAFDDSTLPYDVIRSASLKLPFTEYSVAFPVNPSSKKKIMNIENLDIIHCHTPFTQRASAVRVAKKMNIPVIATFHTKYYDDIFDATKSKLIAKIVTDSIVKFYNSCDSVWACSEATAETLRSYGYKGDVTVMPNGTNIVRPSDHEERRKEAIAKFNIDTNKNNLLFVGSPSRKKNMILILDTLRLLCDLYPGEYNLIIAGSSDELRQTKNYAEKLALKPDEVSFFGQIDDEKELSGIYLASDLLFFPSLYDNAPLVLREAAAMHVPALLAENSNSAEVIEPDINGFVAKADVNSLAEKIKQIFKDKGSLRKAGLKASETIPIPWKKIVSDVYDKYEEIISKKKSMR